MSRGRAAQLLAGITLVAGAVWLTATSGAPESPLLKARAAHAAGEPYEFCVWNVENLFDDADDPRNHHQDEDWFARHRSMVHEKVRLLADTLVRQNGGKGPDILVLIEVENRRAVDQLRAALNARLPSEWRYDAVVYRDSAAGRGNEPAIVTRLAVDEEQTKTFGSAGVLEAHLKADFMPLVVLASHGMSHRHGASDADRDALADALYERVLELTRTDPRADIVIAGDISGDADNPSLRARLHTTANAGKATVGSAPFTLLDLTERLDPGRDGTTFRSGRWEVPDRILAAPGLLDPGGWLILPESIRTEHPAELRFGPERRPWRFGSPENSNPRGPSDHFALSVQLQLAPQPPHRADGLKHYRASSPR